MMSLPNPSRAFSRRHFLAAATLLPAMGRLNASPAYVSEPKLAPPYLQFEPYIVPGNDEFPEEKEASAIQSALETALKTGNLPISASFGGSSPFPSSYETVARDVKRAVFRSSQTIVEGWNTWRYSLGVVRRAQFQALANDVVRYEIASETNGQSFHRVGHWKQRWQNGQLIAFASIDEHVASASQPYFRDVTAPAFRDCSSFAQQLSRGIPFWRSRLDPASGIDIYGSNGIAVGDIDGDGFDEIFVCQPGGLPNRLYKVSPRGAAVDLTDAWGVALLDDTSSALFVDLRNTGRQDLVVLRSSGPVVYLNEGGTFQLRTDAFRFATPPAGGFTGMAAADFDRDGKLDLYFCCYVYFQSEAQYTYASPYHDARNGPPNFLFRNRLNADGSGMFEDCTAETGMNENNDRFSFAPAWCDYNGDGWPDLYVANDFGRKNLYENKDGHFRDVAARAVVEDIGPGMSASWFDADGDGKPDLYVANMWSAAGQRLLRHSKFTPALAESRREAYRRHSRGNSLYKNRGDETFEDISEPQHAEFGRWAWSSGGHDLDNDGQPELFVTCGMLTNRSPVDLQSFFWRQVVGHAPVTAGASAPYENGWNALNQFIREEYSWNGHEPNVLHAKRGDRYYDFSGVSGLDFADDSRAFAVTDFDGDGRPDLILKSRMGPQLRMLQNHCAGEHHSIAVTLQGTQSNRDAIGARIEVDGQTKWLDAGSGFLSQHSKRIVFGLGEAQHVTKIVVTWPSGVTGEYRDLAAGHTYHLVEGTAEARATPFLAPSLWQPAPVRSDNELRLEDTWFLEPIPLPEAQPRDTRLLMLLDGQPLSPPSEIAARVLDFNKEPADKRSCYEIFRRYLFDWRTTLSTPLCFLLNDDGHVAKVYAGVPSADQCRKDARLLSRASSLALPFPGKYLKAPRRDFYKWGAAFLWSGFPEQALPYLDQALRQDPSNARVLVLAGQIRLQAGQIDQAESHFRKAAAENENSAEAWSGLADVSDARGNQAGAVAYFEKSLRIKPDVYATLINAGHAADAADQQPKAAGWYGKALELNPQSAEAANGLGLALAKQGQVEEARRYFQQSIALRKDYAVAINNLGVLYRNEGKNSDAVAAFEYGIRVAPDEDILYLNLGRTYTRAGNNDKAREVMQKLLDRKPANATAIHALQELGSR